MNKTLSAKTFFLSLAVFMVAILTATIMLPHNKYYRYQEHNSGTTRKADWIFERLHYDAAPIDIALIGSSRMGAGLSAPDIEKYYCETTGRKINVANLSIPQTGRNMHFVIAKELFKTKKPELIILELNERETRRPHEDFIFLADTEDILTAPFLINLNHASDIARLPGRQASLFFSTILKRPALREKFQPHAYRGRHLDRTRFLDLLDGRTINREFTIPKEKLDAIHDMRIASSLDGKHLPGALRSLEYRLSRHYVKKIQKISTKSNSNLSFVLLPAYKRPALEEDTLSDLGVRAKTLLLGSDLASDHGYWQDAIHLNTAGAILASRRFAEALAKNHPALGRKSEKTESKTMGSHCTLD